MTPDALTLEAARNFVAADPVLGAVIIILGITLVWRERLHRLDLSDERKAHQVTREALLAEVRKVADIGEETRKQSAEAVAGMRAVAQTMQTAIETFRERRRT